MIAKQIKNTSFLANPLFVNKNMYGFAAAVNKKLKMELTVRTPYKTYLADFNGFSRVLAKTNEAALIIQNKSPAAVYVLPPGNLKVKLNQEATDSDGKPVSGDWLHTGGWVIVGLDNTCSINLSDAVEKSQVQVDQFEKGSFEDGDNLAARYAQKLRKSTARIWTKKATQ